MITSAVAADPCAAPTRKNSVEKFVDCVEGKLVGAASIELLLAFAAELVTVIVCPAAKIAVPPPAAAENSPHVAVEMLALALAICRTTME
jgi:hypothetical protein